MINYTVSWGKKKICVGGQAPILINQLVGCNGTSGVRECIEKIEMWELDNESPDIITDVSLRNDNEKKYGNMRLRRNNILLGRFQYIHVVQKQILKKINF